MKKTPQIIESINELSIYALESEMTPKEFLNEMMALMRLFYKKIDSEEKRHIM